MNQATDARRLFPQQNNIRRHFPYKLHILFVQAEEMVRLDSGSLLQVELNQPIGLPPLSE
jgi:hypothetical protein